jgi:hypothetical protein
MAPAVDHPHPWAHQDVDVSTGDAYLLTDPTHQGSSVTIYCLTFDSICAPKGERSLKFHDYPHDVQLLHANLPDGQLNWNWPAASHRNDNPTLVLPMPDSYSSDGVWHMRFSNHFDATGKAYRNDELHSIGVQLHYRTGPKEFNLLVCDAQQPSVTNCVRPANVHGHTRLTNSGTLRIEMKAPETDWACDPHVRRIYPKMLELVGTPSSSPGPNAKIAYIDPAHGTSEDGSGVYDKVPVGYSINMPQPDKPNQSPYCLEHDSQGNYNDDPPRGIRSASGAPDLAWFTDVHEFVARIKAAPGLDSTLKREYYFDEIEAAAGDLSFPRVSQLRRIEALVALSDARLQADLLNAKAPNAVGASAFQGRLEVIPVLESLLGLEATILEGNGPPTKSGGDCLAAVMQVGR